MSAAPRDGGDARVHDVRFSTYAGGRTSPARSVLVLARWSLLRAFGRRRGWGAKVVPFGILAFAFLPGLGVLTVRALLADRFDGELPIEVLPYDSYLGVIGALIVAWTALVTPELVCPDLRHRVTSLYFATAVSPRQYLAGKWLAAMTALVGLTLLPVLVLFLGNVFFAKSPLDTVVDDASDLPRILGASLIVSTFFATTGLAIAALTGRRAYAIGAFVGVVLASGVLSGVVTEVAPESTWGRALNLVAVPIELGQRLFVADPSFDATHHAVVYAIVVLASAAILLRRFRRAA